MRFKLILERTSKRNFLSFNYQYELSSWIYKIISAADEQFSEFLHSVAYTSGHKRFKLFTFSNLDLRPFQIHKEHRRIEMQGREAILEISFLVDKAAENFIKGLFLHQQCSLGDKISSVDFIVSRIEAVAPPIFKETMSYASKSPLCISTKGDNHAQYLHPAHEKYGQLIMANLLEKFRVMPLAVTGNEEAVLHPDTDYAFKLLSEPKSRLITIKAFTAQQTQVRGYEFKFQLTAPAAFQEIGYYGGFGEKGSLGFGCVREM